MSSAAPTPALPSGATPGAPAKPSTPADLPRVTSGDPSDLQHQEPAPGDPRVDDALSRLAELDGMPLAEQVEVFGDIHRRLDGVLADPDSRG